MVDRGSAGMPRSARLGLRGRLVLLFVAITVIPLLLAVGMLQGQVNQHLRERAEAELTSVGRAATAIVDARLDRAGDVAEDLVGLITGGPQTIPDLPERVAAAMAAAVPDRVDVVALIGPDGTVLAEVRREPEHVTAGPPDQAALGRAVHGGEEVLGLLAEVRGVGSPNGVPTGEAAWVLAGLWADEQLLTSFGIAGSASLVADDAVLAVTGAEVAAVPAVPFPPDGDPPFSQMADGATIVTGVPLGRGPEAQRTMLLLWAPALQAAPGAPLLLVVIPAVLTAGALGWIIAGAVVRPVQRAAEAANAVADGDLTRWLAPEGGRELTALSVALNTMSAQLAERMTDLQASEERLRESLGRLGQALSSSLDLNRTLAVIVETAVATLGADRAVLMLVTAERDGLYPKVVRGFDEPIPRVRTDDGLLGHVIRTGAAVRLPEDAPRVPEGEDALPGGPCRLLVPMMGRGRVLGVLVLVRDHPARRFESDELDTLRTFAAQASVSIENVLLHHEARRLAVTDPLTGLWNFRYFQMQADREVESAARFERPLSLVIVDLDHFKDVNDTYGHQVGDEILVEVARRLRTSTRVPDIVARYGGEEFVALLPGTDLQGALATAARIHAAVRAEPIQPTAKGITATAESRTVPPQRITCSIGVATLPLHGRTVAGLLRSADAAMYAAKSQGRDCIRAAGT
jgi:two-component system, cell cycle response regulator